jgi:hypothetical protein
MSQQRRRQNLTLVGTASPDGTRIRSVSADFVVLTLQSGQGGDSPVTLDGALSECVSAAEPIGRAAVTDSDVGQHKHFIEATEGRICAETALDQESG